MERSRVSWRGPVYGLRPVCSASIWYMGLPPPPPAAAGAGEAAAAGEAAGLAAGLATAAAAGLAPVAAAGDADATGAITGGVVGLGVAAGALVTVIGWGGLWQATSKVVAASATPSAQRIRT